MKNLYLLVPLNPIDDLYNYYGESFGPNRVFTSITTANKVIELYESNLARHSRQLDTSLGWCRTKVRQYMKDKHIGFEVHEVPVSELNKLYDILLKLTKEENNL